MEQKSILNKYNEQPVKVHVVKETNQADQMRPDFSRAELNSVIIPRKIAKEVRWEKYWILLINLLGTGFSLVAGFFLLVWYLGSPVVNETTKIVTKWLIPEQAIPQPGFMFALLSVGLLVWIVSWIEYAHVISSVNRYKGDILMNIQSIPYFLVKSYRSAVARVIYLNWICISTYVITAIIIGVLFAISGIGAAVKSEMPLITEKNICYIILGLTFGFHIFSLIIVKYRKGNLNSFYGKELITLEEQKQITKTANRRCLVTFIIFISIVLVFVVIPYMIVRKRKGLKPIPFL